MKAILRPLDKVFIYVRMMNHPISHDIKYQGRNYDIG